MAYYQAYYKIKRVVKSLGLIEGFVSDGKKNFSYGCFFFEKNIEQGIEPNTQPN